MYTRMICYRYWGSWKWETQLFSKYSRVVLWQSSGEIKILKADDKNKKLRNFWLLEISDRKMGGKYFWHHTCQRYQTHQTSHMWSVFLMSPQVYHVGSAFIMPHSHCFPHLRTSMWGRPWTHGVLHASSGGGSGTSQDSEKKKKLCWCLFYIPPPPWIKSWIGNSMSGIQPSLNVAQTQDQLFWAQPLTPPPTSGAHTFRTTFFCWDCCQCTKPDNSGCQC